MRYRTTQLILILGATALLGVFLVLWYQTARTDAVLAWAEDLPAHTRVERGHLRVVKVGVDHDFPVLEDPGRVVGYYTTRPITGRGLVLPTDVAQSLPPQRHVFPNGELLPQGADGYGFPLSQPLAATLSPGDLVDVYLVVPGEELMYLLLQEFPILYRLEEPPVAALALTPEQVAVVEGMMAKTGSGDGAQDAEGDGRSPGQDEMGETGDEDSLQGAARGDEQGAETDGSPQGRAREDEDFEPPYYLVLPTQGENPDREPLAAFPFEPADPSVLAPVE